MDNGRISNEMLRQLCIENQWFTQGSNRQYEKLFEMDGMKLKIGKGVLELIVDTAIENKLGARGLRSICEKIMTDAMFDAPSSSSRVFNLTLDYAKSRLQATD